MKTIDLKIRKNYNIKIVKWEVEKPKGVIQLIHGSLEHCARYDEVAKMFNKKGFSVIGDDHRGHGQTAVHNKELLGHVGHKANHKTIITDLLEVNKYIRKNNKDIPIVLFGHSWGSYLARCLMPITSADYQGAILSGTGWVSQISAKFALFMLKVTNLLKGFNDAKSSNLVHKKSFLSFNKKFTKKPVTGLEWCSNDKVEQQKFFKDKLRGERFSIAGFRALIGAAKVACSKKTFKRIDAKKIILIASGEDDPVGGMGKGIKKVERKFQKRGFPFITTKLYKGQRHEIHLDTGKEKYFKDLGVWLDDNIK